MKEGKYHLAVPVMTITNREMLARQLQEIKCDRVWIALDRTKLFQNAAERNVYIEQLKEHLQFFETSGLETGIWISAFGYGCEVSGKSNKKLTENWVSIRGITQKEEMHIDAFCPEDPEFTKTYCQFVKDIAEIGPKLIMLDDDLCLSIRPGLGCFCDRHMELLAERLGRSYTREELRSLIFTGGENQYRDAWLEVMGKSILDFCEKVRKTVDEIDDTIRVGFCAGYTSWDIEGANAIEVSRVLAGKNQPFLRFTSAPYWVTRIRPRFPGMQLNTVIETARVQEQWCRNLGVEIFTENDSYPRPRYHVPASLVECFDIAMRANGGVGTLKYMMDYVSSPMYEKGYLQRHKKNELFYEWIHQNFKNKKAKGVRVYHEMQTIRHADLPERLGDWDEGGEQDVMYRFFSTAASVLTEQSIPVTYEDDESNIAPDYAVAFGEDSKWIDLSKLAGKMILDLPAAIRLQERGVDVGLLSWQQTEVQTREHFLLPGHSEEMVGLDFSGIGRAPYLGSGYFSCHLAENAQIQSYFVSIDNRIPGSYIYCNGHTEFLVLLVDAYICGQSSSAMCSYQRQQQLLEFIDRKFPYIEQNPGIYTIYKESNDGSKAAVLFENLSEDSLDTFDIQIGRACSKCDIYGVRGQLSGDRKILHVDGEVAPWGCIALSLEFTSIEE